MTDGKLVCYCGHLENEHKLILETYILCEECFQDFRASTDALIVDINPFKHEFKADNLRYLEHLTNETKHCK